MKGEASHEAKKINTLLLYTVQQFSCCSAQSINPFSVIVRRSNIFWTFVMHVKDVDAGFLLTNHEKSIYSFSHLHPYHGSMNEEMEGMASYPVA